MQVKRSITDLIQAHEGLKVHKNRLDWDKLELRRYPPKALKKPDIKPIHAFDTETLDGYVKLLACDDRRYVEPDNIEAILSYLTQKDYRDSINFFYNIQYDFDSIMKFMDADILLELINEHKITYGGYKLSYIPKKCFDIKIKKNTWKFYDLAQFYEMSLAHASEMYINGVKNEDNLDRALIGSSAEYWEENHDLIVKYCIQDCYLTAELGKLLQQEIFTGCGFIPKQYVSKAGLSKRYFRENVNLPFWKDIPTYASYFAFQAYHGGRFEVTERGKVGYCSNLDICSAYPYQISELIDVRLGRWKRTNELNPEAYYGFYLAYVDIPYQYLPPLAFDWGGTVIYPCGDWVAYFTKEELEALEGIGHYQVISGVEFYPDRIEKPFYESIHKLYDLKAVTPKTDFKYALYKKIMNSFYGATYEKYKQSNGLFKTGICFFPVYATLITANTRLQLWKKAHEYGKRCISLATDGLLIKGEVENENTKVLGSWEKDKAGEAYILRSGIYSVGEEVKQRGVISEGQFVTPYGNYANLFDYIKDYPDFTAYPVLNHRPVHLTEAIRHNKKYTKEDINIFRDCTLAFDLNTELKRVYDHEELTGKALLSKRYQSMPHYIEKSEL